MKLTADNVHETFLKCLFKEVEPKDNPIFAEGVIMKIGFHPGRLKENEQNIIDMLDGLSDDFKETGGGGMSFLNACNDKDGNQWADMHRTMEELFVLGIAIGKARFQFPRDMWAIFPGGMPYVVVLNSEQNVQASVASKVDSSNAADKQTKNTEP